MPQTLFDYALDAGLINNSYTQENFEMSMLNDAIFSEDITAQLRALNNAEINALLESQTVSIPEEEGIEYVDKSKVEEEWKPTKTIEHYESLPLMDKERVKYEDWKKLQSDPIKKDKLKTLQDVHDATIQIPPTYDDQIAKVISYDLKSIEEKFSEEIETEEENLFDISLFTPAEEEDDTDVGYIGADRGAEGTQQRLENILPEGFKIWSKDSTPLDKSLNKAPLQVRKYSQAGIENFLIIQSPDGKFHEITSFLDPTSQTTEWRLFEGLRGHKYTPDTPEEAQEKFLAFLSPYLSDEMLDKLKITVASQEEEIAKLFNDAPIFQTSEEANIAAKMGVNLSGGALGLTTNERTNIREKVNNISFELKTESYEGETETVEFLIQPYKKELNEALIQIQQQDVTNNVKRDKPLTIKSPEVQDRARKNMILKRERIVKNNKWEDYIESDEDLGIDRELIRSYVGKRKAEKIEAVDKATYLYHISKNRVVEYMADKTDALQELNAFYDDTSIVYKINPGEKYYKTEDDRLIPAALYENALQEKSTLENKVKLYEDQVDRLEYEVGELDTAEEQWDTLRREYNDAAKFTVQLGVAVADLVISTAYGALNLIPGGKLMEGLGMQDPLKSGMLAWNSFKEDVSDDFKEDQAFDDIENWSDRGEYALQSIAQQLPIIIGMIATGGASVVAGRTAGLSAKALQRLSTISSSTMIGLSSFGGKVGDMEYEEFITGKDLYSGLETYIKGLMYGVVEGTLSAVSTAPILTKGLGKVKGLKLDQAVLDVAEEQGKRQFIRNMITKEILPETLKEIGAESLTTGLQNLIDGRPFFENMEETIVSSGIWGAGMSGSVGLVGLGSRNFANSKELGIIRKGNQDIAAYQVKINELINAKINARGDGLAPDINIDKEFKKLIELRDIAQDKVQEAYNQVEINIKKKGIRDPIYVKQFVDSQGKLADLRVLALEIKNDDTLSIDQKNKQLKELSTTYNAIRYYQNKFTDTDTFGSAWYALGAKAMSSLPFSADRKEYNRIKSEAKKNLKDKGIKKPTRDDINTEAENIMLNEAIEVNIAKDKEISKDLGLDFDEYQTKEQAITDINKRYNELIDELLGDTDGRTTSKALTEKINKLETERDGITNRIKKGTLNGVNVPRLNTSIVVVDNMKANNRSTTGIHEVTHSITNELIAKDPEAFNAMGEQIVHFLNYTGQGNVLTKMQLDNANILNQDGSINYSEVVSSFMEEIVGGTIDLEKMDNQIAVLGRLLNKALEKAGDGFSIPFSGETEILEYFIGFGKALKNGDIISGKYTVEGLKQKFDPFLGREKGKMVDMKKPSTKEQKAAASEIKPSETDNTLYQKTNEIYESDKSMKDKGLEIGELWKNEIKSRLLKGLSVGSGYKIRPTTWDGWKKDSDNLMEDLLSDVATDSYGIPGLVKSYKPGKVPLEAWINKYLDKRILYYIPDNLINTEESIDTSTIRQLEDVKARRFDEDITTLPDTEARDLKEFKDLDIITPELVDEVKDIITKKLKKIAITKGIDQDIATQEIQSLIGKEITKVIKKEMGPITKSILGFAPEQYTDFINKNMETIIGAMPIDIIKQKAKSKAWAKIFQLKEIGKEDIKKVDPKTGKTTYYRKGIFEVVKPDPKEFAKYFTRGGYTTLIERQKSLIQPIAKEIAKTELFKLGKDPDFISDLAERTGMTNNEVSAFYIDNVLSNMQDVLNQTAGEQRSQDVIRFSETLNDNQRAAFSLDSDVLMDNINEGDKGYTLSALKQALIKTYYNNPNNIEFKGKEGLATLNAFAEELFSPLKQIIKHQEKITDVDLNDFIFRGIELNNTATNLIKFFGKENLVDITNAEIQSFAQSFRDPANLQRQRDISTQFSYHLVDKYKKEGLSDFEAKKKAVLTSLKWMRGHQVTSGTVGRRYQGWDGNKDFIENNLNTIPGVNIKGKQTKAGWKIIDIEIDSIDIDANQVKNLIKTPQQKPTIEKQQFESEYDYRKEQSREAWDVMIDFLEFTKDNGTRLDFAMTMMSLKSNMNSVLKAAAPVEYYFVGEGDVGPLRYEHVIPTEYMAMKLTEYFYGDTDLDIDALRNEYTVAIIPQSMDNGINIQLQENMTPDWNPTMESTDRYYNDENMGMKNMYALEILGGKRKGDKIGIPWVQVNDSAKKATPKNIKLDNSSEVVDASYSETNYTTLSIAQQLDKALEIARDPNAPVKKIRVFDFDDTLAKTKSKVIYTMPDGKTGKLSAEEFAKRGDSILEDGGKFDFSEFNKVVDGKKGPFFDIAKRIAEKRGTKDLFVLTARSDEAALEIQTFLSNLGIDIPLENIVGLQNSSPLAKSGWILEKAAEGYNDFYFADDAFKNVKAVKKVLSPLDVKAKVQQAQKAVQSEIDKLPGESGVKFSMTTKRDLKWKHTGGSVTFANFEVKGKEYKIELYNEDRYNYNLWFGKKEAKGHTTAITGDGNAAQVLSIISNGVVDFIKTLPDIQTINFGAKEKSRARLYKTLAELWARKLGWSLDVKTPTDIAGSFELRREGKPWPTTKTQAPAGSRPKFSESKPVQTVLNTVDVKYPTQQTKIRFSETVDQKMNDIIYQKTGIESFKEYSDVRARSEGRGKRSWSLIPPSAEDFGGLLYRMLAKGKLGDAQWEWMQEHLIKPYNRGINDIDVAQNIMAADFKTLKKSLTGIPKNLQNKAFGGFTFEDIVRIAAWDKQNINIEGISKRDLKQIREFLAENPELDVFADQLIALTKQDGYYYPGKDWLAGTITTDLREGLRTNTRSRYLQQWNDNIELAFSNKNLNKIEAAFGSKYREALEDSIRRMKSGTNRNAKMGRLEARMLDYINNSIGAVMFLNTRSAILQTISAINFLNWTDNNPAKAGKAFANQPQYWADFMKLMNSDYLVDRRNGLKINVSESEIAEAAKTSKNKAKAVISTILNKGFVLTQFADSFAIASGGATFYRNRINTYLKEGLSQKEAEAKAFEDFRSRAEEAQQSSDPSKISQQQATTLGKLILAFANTPSQYARIMKKASLDLVHGRGDWKTNISKILYYGMIQNIIFTTLQSGLFAIAFSDEEEEEGILKSKGVDTINSMIDNILRGLGVQGAVISTIKNIFVELYDKSQKKRPEYEDVTFKLFDVSPPIDIKVNKFRSGMNTWEFDRKNPEARDPFNFNNPAYEASAYVIASTTNIPIDRLYRKIENIKGALNDDNEWWKRAAMLLGWPKWQLDSAKEKEEDWLKEKEERHYYKAKGDPKVYNKNEQISILKQHGYTDGEIKEMKNEGTRVATIKAAEKESGKIYTARIPNPKKKKEEKEYKAYIRRKPGEKESSAVKPIPRNKILIGDRTNRQRRLYKLNKQNQIDTLRSLGVTPEVIETLKYEEDRVRKIEKLYDENK